MSDKLMPLTEAVEGYDLFDKMKVQKGAWQVGSDAMHSLTTSSRVRSTKVIADVLVAEGKWAVAIGSLPCTVHQAGTPLSGS